MWRRLALLSLALMAMAPASCSSLRPAAAHDPSSFQGTEKLIAIFTSGEIYEDDTDGELIFAAWPDGKVIWSHDSLKGGPPYETAETGREKFDAWMTRATRSGMFKIKPWSSSGPDASYTTILVRNGDQQLELHSWHEDTEYDGSGVADSHGIRSSPRGRYIDLKEDKNAEHLFHRLLWSEIRASVGELIPRSGVAADGELERRAGEIFWTEDASGPEPLK